MKLTGLYGHSRRLYLGMGILYNSGRDRTVEMRHYNGLLQDDTILVEHIAVGKMAVGDANMRV